MGELAFEMHAPGYSLWGAWRRLIVAAEWTRPVVLSVQAHLLDSVDGEVLRGEIRWQDHPGGPIRTDVIDGGATEITFAPRTLDPMVRFATNGPVRRDVVIEVSHREVDVSLAS